MNWLMVSAYFIAAGIAIVVVGGFIIWLIYLFGSAALAVL